jgi:hypothetical protein
MPVKMDDIEQAFDFVNFGTPYDHAAYVCRDTGEIFFASESGDFDELPEDIEDEKYVALPEKRDLELGKSLVLDFVAENCRDEIYTVDNMFRRKGAYSRFKGFLEDRGLLEQWYDYEAKAQTKALRRWCKDNDIEVSD